MKKKNTDICENMRKFPSVYSKQNINSFSNKDDFLKQNSYEKGNRIVNIPKSQGSNIFS